MTLAERFFALFRGLDRAYGTYQLSGEYKGKKAEGRALTVQQDVTLALWQKHLDGVQGLGIVPIDDDALSYFGAIDIDIYPVDYAALEEKITNFAFPLVMCLTKSGGAHLYCFIRDGQSASEVRAVLKSYAIALGFPNSEIFPKQDALAGHDDVGNWLNMPYFGGTRLCYKNGNQLNAEQFLFYAASRAVDSLQLVSNTDPNLNGAPPCLVMLAQQGVPEGMRNNAMFNFGVLARLQGKNIEEGAEYFNLTYMNPPLNRAESHSIIKSVGRKDYFYRCSQPPIAELCNKSACMQCEYGIGHDDGKGSVQIEALDKICSDPPVWVVQLSGKRVRMNTEELTSQTQFARRCLETINYYPPTVKGPTWTAMLNSLMRSVREIEAPVDASVEGIFLVHLEQFCTTRAPANNKDEILLGKPWHEEGRTFFRSADLFKYLDQQHFKSLRGEQVYAVMRQTLNDVQHHRTRLKGKPVNYWSVPRFDEQEEEFDVPRKEREEEF